jgi:hypothetical protein
MIDEEFLQQFDIVDWGYTEELEAQSYSSFHSWSESLKSGCLDYLRGERALKRKSLRHYYPECQSALVFLFDYSRTRKALKEKKYEKNIAWF